jgi:dihydroorotase
LYAEAFESAGRLDRLEPFASHFGADFYGLPRHDDTITLVRETWVPPAVYDFGDGALVPYRGGEPIAWRLAGVDPA